MDSLLNTFITNNDDLEETLSNSTLADFDVVTQLQNQLDWKAISHVQLSPEFLERFQDQLHWRTLTQIQRWDKLMLDTYHDRVDDWFHFAIFQPQVATEDWIENHLEHYHLPDLLRHIKFSDAFLRRHLETLDWTLVNYHQHLTDNFVKDYRDRLDIPSLVWTSNLSEDFISRELSDDINWDHVVWYHPNLSENFMRNHADKINFRHVFSHHRPIYSQQFLEDVDYLNQADPEDIAKIFRVNRAINRLMGHWKNSHPTASIATLSAALPAPALFSAAGE